jgi:DNA-binding transcriptional LysR family regulator
VDLGLLETFRAVVRAGGMRRAAASLHVTQPAVSGRIRELERQLDVQLFERVGRRLHLTDAGDLVLAESASLLAAADSLTQRLIELGAAQSGTLRLASIDAVSIHLLSEIYRSFVQQHPHVALRVHVVDSHRVLEAVRDLEVELGFFAMPPVGATALPPEIVVEPFFADELCCVANPSHELVGRRRLDLATLAAAPLILYSSGSHTRAVLDEVFRTRAVPPNVVMETGSPEAMQRLAEAGVGIAILPRTQIRDAEAHGRLRRLRPASTRFVRTLAIARRRDRHLGPHARRFVDRVRARWPPGAHADGARRRGGGR